MGTPAPLDKMATLEESEYRELAEKAARDVIELFEDKQNWTSTNYGDETFVVSLFSYLKYLWNNR